MKTAKFHEWARLMRVKNSRRYRKREKEQRDQIVQDKVRDQEQDREIKYLKQKVTSLKEILADAKERESENLKRE